ncbi:hypothetical protein B0O99DRAFT_727253 [Bisporella sp. PMI_857]|nr:hypothetical protein B0O99DRAFT_727253 [Bisporella sp. PMI_857]
MISSSSGFLSSSITVPHNAVKSLLFRCAELLLGISVYKFFSLLAAIRCDFTAYLMFAESLLQKVFFIYSRGISGGGLQVLMFTFIFAIANLYGTLLWALDAPGYVAKGRNVTVASIASSLVDNPNYVISIPVLADLNRTDHILKESMEADLFQPGVNFSLTGTFDRGSPAILPPQRAGEGPRIWLDEDGFSVATDTRVMTSVPLGSPNVLTDQLYCPNIITAANNNQEQRVWNCSFQNKFAYDITQNKLLGRVEVHWDEASDRNYSFTYVDPNPRDNIWASMGTGAGNMAMMQMFTVAKEKRKHTFVATILKTNLATASGTPLSPAEVRDLIWRTANPTAITTPEQLATLANTVTLISAQSHAYGINYGAENGLSVAQVNYELLNVDGLPGERVYTMFRVSIVNITLVRSESIEDSPTPFDACDSFFANQAAGGKVYMTDCVAHEVNVRNGGYFWGQTDISAVLLLQGLGKSAVESNTSVQALPEQNYQWTIDNHQRIENLLLSRGYILGLDPALVSIELSVLGPAVSYLQVLLVTLAALLAAVSWVCLSYFPSIHWSFTSLINLIVTTNNDSPVTVRLGYIRDMPEIHLVSGGTETVMRTDAGVFKLEGDLVSLGLRSTGLGDDAPVQPTQMKSGEFSSDHDSHKPEMAIKEESREANRTLVSP